MAEVSVADQIEGLLQKKKYDELASLITKKSADDHWCADLWDTRGRKLLRKFHHIKSAYEQLGGEVIFKDLHPQEGNDATYTVALMIPFQVTFLTPLKISFNKDIIPQHRLVYVSYDFVNRDGRIEVDFRFSSSQPGLILTGDGFSSTGGTLSQNKPDRNLLTAEDNFVTDLVKEAYILLGELAWLEAPQENPLVDATGPSFETVLEFLPRNSLGTVAQVDSAVHAQLKEDCIKVITKYKEIRKWYRGTKGVWVR